MTDVRTKNTTTTPGRYASMCAAGELVHEARTLTEAVMLG